MRSTKLPYSCVLILSALLAACGGGSGESGSTGTPTPAPTTPTPSNPAPSNPAPTNPAPVTPSPTPVLPSGPPAGAACPTTNSTVALAGGTQLAVGASRSNGVAPLAVFFDASGTTSSVTSRPFHEIEYRWTFGESGSGTWANGAKAGTASRNEAMGPVAAHVFESAGTFPITVSAFNGTSTVSYSCNITVTSADAEFAGNKTVCVSAVGNFAGCPAGASQVTSSNPTTAVANNMGAGNKRILFARGETYSTTSTIQINRPGPGLIGAYGTGAKPMFLNASSIGTFAMSSMSTPAISDWRLVDLRIDGGGFVSSTAIYGGGSINNVLINRVDIQNVKNGVSFSHSNLDAINNSGFTSPMWDGIFITNSTVYNLVGTGATGGNGFYVGAWRLAVMGNNINNNFNGEHGMRSAYSDRSVWQHNTIQGIASGRAFLTLRSPGQGEATLSTQLPGVVYTQKLLASDNHLIGSSATSGFAGTGPTNQGSSGRAREQIWERNLLVGGSGTSGYFGFAGYQITARNNIMIIPAGSASMAFAGQPLDVSPNPTDIWIYNNSIYYGGTDRFQLLVLVGGSMAGSQYTVRNNLWYGPNSSDGTQINNIAGSTLTTCPNCNTALGEEGEVKLSPRFTASPPTTAAAFKPLAGSYAIGRAMAVPVWSDYFGVPTTGSRDLGAIRH
jgi:hypothetical protein